MVIVVSGEPHRSPCQAAITVPSFLACSRLARALSQSNIRRIPASLIGFAVAAALLARIVAFVIRGLDVLFAQQAPILFFLID